MRAVQQRGDRHRGAVDDPRVRCRWWGVNRRTPVDARCGPSGCAAQPARYDGSEEANVVAYKLPIESIIGRESALRKIPSNVEARGRLHLDAIRCCIEAIGLGYARLVHQAVIADQTMAPGAAPPLGIFADSWALVDWVHRMHDLVNHAPGLKTSPGKSLFLRETTSADRLRNAFQHPTGEYAKAAPDGTPWGTISWVVVVDAHHARSYTLLIGGATEGARYPISAPAGNVRGPADLFEVFAFGEHASISKWFDAVTAFAHELEERVTNANERLGEAAAPSVTDLLARMDFEF
jgi:hypothetical protein